MVLKWSSGSRNQPSMSVFCGMRNNCLSDLHVTSRRSHTCLHSILLLPWPLQSFEFAMISLEGQMICTSFKESSRARGQTPISYIASFHLVKTRYLPLVSLRRQTCGPELGKLWHAGHIWPQQPDFVLFVNQEQFLHFKNILRKQRRCYRDCMQPEKPKIFTIWFFQKRFVELFSR